MRELKINENANLKKIRTQLIDLMFEVFYNDKMLNKISTIIKDIKVLDEIHHFKKMIKEVNESSNRMVLKFMEVINSINGMTLPMLIDNGQEN